MSGFGVIDPGILSQFQDAGRFGYHAMGLTTGGPVDGEAFYWANRLVGNQPGETVIEVAVGGLKLESEVAKINLRMRDLEAFVAKTFNGLFEKKQLYEVNFVVVFHVRGACTRPPQGSFVPTKSVLVY